MPARLFRAARKEVLSVTDPKGDLVMLKLLWMPVFWFLAAIVAYGWNLDGIFLVIALAVGTAVALWVTSGDSKAGSE
jgi:hypothetical protein